MSKAENINDVILLTAKFDKMDMDTLRNTADTLRNKIEQDAGIIILASEQDGKVNFIAATTKKAVAKGLHAGNIIREAAKLTGGGGGGRPDMAQAGGKDPSKIDAAFAKARELIK